MNIEEILNASKDTLNLEVHRKALILKALITTAFVLKDAYLLNYPQKEKSYDTYYREFLVHFPEGIVEIRKQCSLKQIVQ